MFRSKREVLSSIREHKFTKGGKEYTIFSAFLGRDPISNKGKRVARSDKNELRQYISDFYTRLDKGGDNAVQLDHAQSADAHAAYGLMAQFGLQMTLADVVRAYATQKAYGELKGDCKTSVGEAWHRYSGTLWTKSEAYRKCVTSRIGAWVHCFGENRLLSEVSASELKEYLMDKVFRPEKPDTAKTYNNVLGDIKTFIHWCCAKEQDLLAVDPLDGMKKMEIGYRQPEYMKAADVEKLFRVLEARKEKRPENLADAILSFFCGVRQCEIARVREGESAVKISLEDHFIRIVKVKGSLRGIRPRAFKIPAQAEAWMRSFDFMAAVQIPNTAFRYHLNMAAKKAGIKMPKNAGRHTFITMYEAAHHDTNALSGIVGNTEGVRSRSYNGVELEREGRAYFEIMPTSSAS